MFLLAWIWLPPNLLTRLIPVNYDFLLYVWLCLVTVSNQSRDLKSIRWDRFSTWCNKTCLNVKILFARVMDKKGKGFLPHWVAGAKGSLKWDIKRSVFSRSVLCICLLPVSEMFMKVFLSLCSKYEIYTELQTHPALFGGILNRKLHQRTRILIAFLHLYGKTPEVIHKANAAWHGNGTKSERTASKLKAGLTGRSWPRSRYTVKMAAEGGSVLPNVVMFWFFWRTCGIKQGFGEPIL